MTQMAVQQYCLRWNNHQPNFISMFSSLLTSESLVDVTLAADGKHLRAHKVVLSACSSYFQSLFTLNPCQHPIVILKDIKYDDLKVMVDFMYYGEVNVSQEQLPAILKTAETLKVKGLAETPEQNISLSKSVSLSSEKSCESPSMRRKRFRKSSTGSGSGSGSTEHTGTLTGGSEETVGSVDIPTVKTELASEGETSLRHEPSTESEPGCTSQESVDDESHQGIEDKVEERPSEVILPSSSLQSPSSSPSKQLLTAGSSLKRGRLLTRQNRIKKECDVDDLILRPICEPTTTQQSCNLLTVPQPVYQHSSPQSSQHSVNPDMIKIRTEELRRASSTPICSVSSIPEGSRSFHCPVLRPGPALGCNYCWNTIDAHGRILRRKTKYHCPECQTNLCIVPCFQEYHERQGTGLSETPSTLVPTIMKTSSLG